MGDDPISKQLVNLHMKVLAVCVEKYTAEEAGGCGDRYDERLEELEQEIAKLEKAKDNKLYKAVYEGQK